MKTLFPIASLLVAINLFGSETKLVSSNNPDFQSLLNDNSKITLNKSTEKSTGLSFLENDIKRTRENVESVEVHEIYTANLASGWKGAIFDTKTTFFNDTVEKGLRKVFYNDTLAVREIYNKKAEPISKMLKLPLVSPLLAYNDEFLIHKSDPNKESPHGKNIVVFSNIECPMCKRLVPSILEFGILNNMNIYMYNITSDKFFNSKNLSTFMIAYSKKNKESFKGSEYIEKLKKLYVYQFSSLSKEELLKEFNRILESDITLEDISKSFSEDVLKTVNRVAEKLYVNSTPTVYIDGNNFDDFGDL